MSFEGITRWKAREERHRLADVVRILTVALKELREADAPEECIKTVLDIRGDRMYELAVLTARIYDSHDNED